MGVRMTHEDDNDGSAEPRGAGGDFRKAAEDAPVSSSEQTRKHLLLIVQRVAARDAQLSDASPNEGDDQPDR